MRFSCAQCNIAYNIPDSRVAGKILKIRCRRCSHVNTVDGSKLSPSPTPDPEPEPIAATASDSPPDAADPGDGDGQETAVVLDPPEEESAPPPVAPPSQETETKSDAAGPIDSEMGPPPENTRMAIEQAGMAHRAEKHKAYAMGAVVVLAVLIGALVLDAMGIIEIPLVHTAVVAAKNVVSAPAKPEKKPWVSILTEEERAAIRKALLEGNKEEVKRIRHKARKRAKKMGYEIDLSDQIVGGAVSSDDLKRREKTTTASVDLTTDQQDALKGLLNREMKPQTKINIKPSLPEIRVPTRSEGGLTAKQVGKVIGENQGGINFCATQETKRGLKLPPKLTLTVSVVGYGKVTGVVINNAEFRNTSLGKCLMGKAKIWRFPEFTGDPMDIEIPLKFTTVH